MSDAPNLTLKFNSLASGWGSKASYYDITYSQTYNSQRKLIGKIKAESKRSETVFWLRGGYTYDYLTYPSPYYNLNNIVGPTIITDSVSYSYDAQYGGDIVYSKELVSSMVGIKSGHYYAVNYVTIDKDSIPITMDFCNGAAQIGSSPTYNSTNLLWAN